MSRYPESTEFLAGGIARRQGATCRGGPSEAATSRSSVKETATGIVKRLGTVGSFNISTGICHLSAHALGGKLAPARYQCPPIRSTSSTYNDNLFELELGVVNGAVFWNSRDAIVSGNGTTVHHRRYGAYRSDGKKIYMHFGASNAEKDLTADIVSAQEISVGELEPSCGNCKQ